jgi:hypothetical protein
MGAAGGASEGPIAIQAASLIKYASCMTIFTAPKK